ncbi:MAG: NAD(P)/FAD-dependent oxidoreductase [Phycisphaerae bacterium]
MPILVRNIMLPLNDPEDRLPSLVAKRLGVGESDIMTYAVVSRAVDARRGEVRFAYQLEVSLGPTARSEEAVVRRARDVLLFDGDRYQWSEPAPGKLPMRHRPIVVGFGPAGMFAALRLAMFGYRPLVLERGRAVRRRHRDIMRDYYRERQFHPESNLLFGEGGAGTYSDGKLYTRVNDPLCRYVLEVLYRFGADPDILVNTRPHVGSDRLPTVCTRLREHIESLGGDIAFGHRLSDVRIGDGELDAIEVSDADTDAREWHQAGPVLLGLGHSARDTIAMLVNRGVTVSAKPFQIGVRIEHPQSQVDQWQYGAACGHARLAAAEYHLVAKGASENGDLFSFCMCPGGEILPTNETHGLIATNGASKARRGSPFANSGLVITMDPAAMGYDALQALNYQARWEKLAFDATGGSYAVPCHRASDFLAERASDGDLATSFPLGGRWTDVRGVIPNEVSRALQRGLVMLDRKLPGFAGEDAIITAPETRASAPIRMDRDKETREAHGVRGLFPMGEGAGYAGGIVSAAIDGIKTADELVRRFAPPIDA